MQTQVWPELRYLATIAPSTAVSMSASSNTMNGALPPSSIDTFFTVTAHSGHQQLADLGRAGEGELLDQPVRADLVADLAGRTGDDVDHALGEADFLASTPQARPE